MKKKINGKFYDFPKEIVDYIDELEYYHNYTIGKRVVDIHFGIVGTIQMMFKSYHSIPNEILPDKEAFFNSLGKIVSKGHKEREWFVVKTEVGDSAHIFPAFFWKIMPPIDGKIIPEEDLDDSDENDDFNGEASSDD